MHEVGVKDAVTAVMIVYVKLLRDSILHLCSVSQVAARVLSIQEPWVHVLVRTLSFAAFFCVCVCVCVCVRA